MPELLQSRNLARNFGARWHVYSALSFLTGYGPGISLQHVRGRGINSVPSVSSPHLFENIWFLGQSIVFSSPSFIFFLNRILHPHETIMFIFFSQCFEISYTFSYFPVALFVLSFSRFLVRFGFLFHAISPFRSPLIFPLMLSLLASAPASKGRMKGGRVLSVCRLLFPPFSNLHPPLDYFYLSLPLILSLSLDR